MHKRQMKLGEILVRHGAINLGQMHEALCRQRIAKIRIGDLIVDLGMATPSEVNAAVAEQEWRQGNITTS